VIDLGDTGTDADDLCTTTTYNPNENAWLVDFPSRVETVSLRCGQTPQFPEDAVSDTLTYYVGQHDALPPTTSNPTEVRVAAERPAAGPVYVVAAKSTHDVRGRIRTATDALGNTTTTQYTPAVAGPVTQTVTTTPGPIDGAAGFATTTTFDAWFGRPTKIVDPNNRTTELAYDALGRSIEVWLPNHPRQTYADGTYEFSYLVRNNGPNAVTTKTLAPKGNYVTTKELYDGLLRPRQKQSPAPGGGRLLSDTRYDSHGRAVKATQPYYNSGALDDALWLPTDNVVPGMTIAEFDGAGRPTAQAYLGFGNEKWRTSAEFGGDRVTVTPPRGGTTTTTVNDARGRTVELHQHGPAGADLTRYEYTPAGELAKVTDPGDNIWTYTHDLRGRKTEETDPDRGQATFTYDDADQLVSTTDARGVTLFYEYDNLGRKTVLHKDSVTGDRPRTGPTTPCQTARACPPRRPATRAAPPTRPACSSTRRCTSRPRSRWRSRARRGQSWPASTPRP
jgi:YD repeat-containing protein